MKILITHPHPKEVLNQLPDQTKSLALKDTLGEENFANINMKVSEIPEKW